MNDLRQNSVTMAAMRDGRAVRRRPRMIFLPGPACAPRPRKSSKDRPLRVPGMPIEWLRAYESRTDEFSHHSHRLLFGTHGGPKTGITRQ